MGRLLLVGRLVARSIRRRPIEALLTVVAITAATTTLTLGLSLYGVTNHPYQTTRALTRGPDIVAMPGFPGGSGELHDLMKLASAPGVVSHGGPYPTSFPVMKVKGLTVLAIAEGRSTAPAAIDQPYVTEGTWVRSGGVVVERSFAEELGLTIGEPVTLGSTTLRVVGFAVTAAVPAYPMTMSGVMTDSGGASDDTGMVWVTEPAARSLATAGSPLSYMLDLRLSNSTMARSFEGRYVTDEAVFIESWFQVSEMDAGLFNGIQKALLIISWLFGLLAIASLAVVVAGRVIEQSRRVGLLKAVGGTPGLVAIVLLMEYLALAMVAAAVGLGLGVLVAPLLDSPGAGLLGSAGAPSIGLVTVGWVLVVALVVAVLAALVPSIRASRTSTTAALNEAAHAPKRRKLLIAAAAWLPVPLLLGLRLAARRPRRMMLSAFSVAVTVTTLVAVLTVHAHQGSVPPGHPFGGFSRLPNPRTARDDEVLVFMTAMLAVLACVNALVITWTTYVDSRRPLAVARSLGASPRQLGASLSATLLLPATPGALAGLPLGILLVRAVSGGDVITTPPVTWLAAAFAGTLLVLAGLSALPARVGASDSVAETLQSELA